MQRIITGLSISVLLLGICNCSSQIGSKDITIETPIIYEDWDTPPELVYQVPPKYPQEEREEGIEGKVVLTVVISSEGNVVDAQVISSEPRASFGPAALEAVLQFKFKPAIKNGKPITVRIGQTLIFSLRADI